MHKYEVIEIAFTSLAGLTQQINKFCELYQFDVEQLVPSDSLSMGAGTVVVLFSRCVADFDQEKDDVLSTQEEM